jgi:hypothetical protein
MVVMEEEFKKFLGILLTTAFFKLFGIRTHNMWLTTTRGIFPPFSTGSSHHMGCTLWEQIKAALVFRPSELSAYLW